MSKPRYGWWAYVKDMIRRYPSLKSEYRDLHSQSMTAQYSDMLRGGGNSRAIESLAVEVTERYRNGRDRLYVIKMVLWKHSHTLEGAALMVPCSDRTAKQWHGEFVKLVALNYGLMD